MDKLKLLIADGTEDFALALADALQGVYQIRQCADGIRAREILQSFRPDLMLLDLMLPGLDGISLLQWAAEMRIFPVVLAATRFVNDYVLESAARLGVEYVMVKPCDIRATIARLGDLNSRIGAPVTVRPDPESQVSSLLLALGVPAKLRGFSCLRESILQMEKNPNQSITKELYPEVAQRCCCETANVERNIRNAIDAAWSRRDDRLWRLYFAADESGSIPRPSNGAFIIRLAAGLRDSAREWEQEKVAEKRNSATGGNVR